MATHQTLTSLFSDIADAIRDKKGESSSVKYVADNFDDAITSIPTGITPTGNIELQTQTGTDVTNYATASVKNGGVSLSDVSLAVTPSVTPTPTASASGNVTLGSVTSTQPSSGYYISATGGNSKTTGNTTSGESCTVTKTAGWIDAGTSTVASTATATANASSQTVYYPMATSTCTVAGGGLSQGTASGGGLSGGGLSVTTNYSATPTITLSNGSDTNMSNITVGSKDTTNYPYYFKVNSTSSKLTGTTKATRAAVTRAAFSQTVTRADITDAHTAGWMPAKSAATVIASDSSTVSLAADSSTIGETSVSPSVTVNAGSGNSYVGLKSAALGASGSVTTSGSGSVNPGTNTISKNNNTNVSTGSITTTKPSSGYYVAVDASTAQNTGSISVSGTGTASASVSTAGYAPTTLTGSGSVSGSGVATVTVPAKSASTTYLPITGTSLSAGAGSASLSGSNVTLSDTNNGISVTATGSGSVSVGTAGYLASGTSKSSSSATSTKYISSVTVPTNTAFAITTTANTSSDSNKLTVTNGGYRQADITNLASGTLNITNASLANITNTASIVVTNSANAHIYPYGTSSSHSGRVYVSAWDQATSGTLSGDQQIVDDGNWITNTVTPTTSQLGPYYGKTTVNGDANLVAANIAQGVTIFGVEGTHSGGITPTGNIELQVQTGTDVTNYATASVISGSASTPATTQAQSTPTISVNSSGLVTANVAATSVDVTPSVTAGWISSGTAGTITMSASSNTYQLTTYTDLS